MKADRPREVNVSLRANLRFKIPLSVMGQMELIADSKGLSMGEYVKEIIESTVREEMRFLQ